MIYKQAETPPRLTGLFIYLYTHVMSKLKNPLFSLEGHGKLGAITMRHTRSATIAETIPKLKDMHSDSQVSWRTMFEKCTLLWHALSAAEKKTWEALATPKHMTGYALWQSQCLRPNPGIYLPLAGGTMQGAIDMSTHAITTLPDPTANQDADTLAARNAAIALTFPQQLSPIGTSWTTPGWYSHATIYSLITAGRIYYIPIFVTKTITFIRIGIYVDTGSAGTCDLRVFSWLNGLPNSLILNAGTVNTAATGYKEITISLTLTRGYYFLAARFTGTPTVSGPSTASAVFPPVPGFISAGTGYNPSVIFLSTAPYFDPALTPSSLTTANFACVSLREL